MEEALLRDPFGEEALAAMEQVRVAALQESISDSSFSPGFERGGVSCYDSCFCSCGSRHVCIWESSGQGGGGGGGGSSSTIMNSSFVE